MLSSVSVEVSTGRAMDPSKGSGQGPFHSEGSVPAKGFVLGKGPSPSEVSVVPGKGSVPARGSGKGPFYINGSGPVALEGSSVVGQGKGHGTISGPSRVTGVPFDQEFPIMTHFRLRRLLAFLACTRFSSAFQAQSVDWHLVGLKAAEIVGNLITQTPEFSEFLRLPRLPSDLHDVINVFPHGFRSRRICRVKKAGRVPGSVIAKHFLSKQRFHDAGPGKNRLGLLTDPPAWLRASIDEALKAGTRTVMDVLHQEHHGKYAYDEAYALSPHDANPHEGKPSNLSKRRKSHGDQDAYNSSIAKLLKSSRTE
ncbi:unnamed protein product [Urochloa humidicola]